MKYICQLKDGYMLAELVPNRTYGIVHTGYPYPDTEKPSQEMLEDLRRSLDVKDGGGIETVAQLADSLSYLLGQKVVLNRKMLKSLLNTGTIKLNFTIYDETASVLFDCPLFTVYLITEVYRSTMFSMVVNYLEDESVTGGNSSMILCHIHKGICQLKVRTAKPDNYYIRAFDRALESELSISGADLKLYLTKISENLDKINTGVELFNKDFMYEGFICQGTNLTIVERFERDSSQLCSSLGDKLNAWGTYLHSNDSSNTIRRTFEEIYKFDMFCLHEKYAFVQGSCFKLALMCIFYSLLEESQQKLKLKTDIMRNVTGLIKRLGVFSSKFYYIIKDDNIWLLGSPYIYFGTKKGILPHGTIYTENQKNGIMTMPDGRKVFAICLHYDWGGLITDYEARLYQYFVLKQKRSIFNRQIPYWGSEYEEGHDSAFDGIDPVDEENRSIRNILKVLQPNFDKLFLFGEYGNKDMAQVLTNVYCYKSAVLRCSSLYKKALNWATQGVDFSEGEEDFILSIASAYSRNLSVGIEFQFFNTKYDDKIMPRISDDFIKKLYSVLKVYILTRSAFEEEDTVEVFRDFDYCFESSDYTLRALFRRKRV